MAFWNISFEVVVAIAIAIAVVLIKAVAARPPVLRWWWSWRVLSISEALAVFRGVISMTVTITVVASAAIAGCKSHATLRPLRPQ